MNAYLKTHVAIVKFKVATNWMDGFTSIPVLQTEKAGIVIHPKKGWPSAWTDTWSAILQPMLQV